MIRRDLGIWRSRRRRRGQRRRSAVSTQSSAFSGQHSVLFKFVVFKFVILSEAKDLLSCECKRKQVLRFAQDDNPLRVSRGYVLHRSQTNRFLCWRARSGGARAAVRARAGIGGRRIGE